MTVMERRQSASGSESTCNACCFCELYFWPRLEYATSLFSWLPFLFHDGGRCTKFVILRGETLTNEKLISFSNSGKTREQ